MKKFILNITFIICLVTGKSFSQVKNNLSFGPVIGFGSSTVSGDIDNEAQKKFHPSYNTGLRLTYSAHPHWGFGGDISFRTEGAKLRSTVTDEQVYLNSNYIRLDPKAYYFFGKRGQVFRPKISLGPSFGFLAGGKIKYYEGNTLLGEQKISDYAKNFDFGVAAALGFNYRIKSSMWLNVDAAYTHGLLNIIQDNTDEAVRNRNILMTIGVLFGIGSAKSK